MPKTTKRLISIIALAMALLTLVSCQPSIPDDTTVPQDTTTAITPESIVTTATVEETTAVPEPVLPDGLILAGPELETVCTVVYPIADSKLKAAAEALIAYINNAVPDAKLTAIPDTDTVATEYKIVIATPDSASASNYTVKIDGKSILLSGKTYDAVLDAVNYFKAFSITDGYLVIDEALDFASAAGPEVLSQYPEKYYYYEDVYTPSLAYTFDAKKVNTKDSRLYISGEDVTDKAVWSDGVVTLTEHTVEAGDHIVLLALANNNGDVEVYETTFSCGDGSVMNLYSGEVHAHTSDSDGQSTIQEAYKYARDVAKLDFFSVTDHSNSFANSVYQNSHIPNADAYNEPGKFVALYGYEQTYNIKTGYYGHLNTINYGSLTLNSLPLRQYYTLMARDENAVVMFNHPGYTWGNFIEYDLYSEEADSVVNLSEIKSKNVANYEYALSLTKGWHTSPIYNEDNHSANWGNAYEYCGYALAPALTRQNIIEAFKKNRTYTTSDKTLKIYYKINDEWMGSRLDNPDNLHFSVQLSTEKPQGLGTISIIAEDGIIVAYKAVGTKKEYTFELDLPPHYDYYYVKVESGNTWCYTAPIWIENREHLTMSELSHDLITGSSDVKDYRVYANVTNNTAKEMVNVEVEFFLSATSGFIKPRQKAVETVRLDSIAPGATVTVYADVKYAAATPRVYAVAAAEQDGKQYGAVRYMEISNIYFSEILPLTARGGAADSFEFIELYNNSDSVIDLSKFTMRYYKKAGAKAADLEANTWKLSGKIQPHSTLVIWMVSDTNKLTVADFNSHFKTSLVEGKDIVRLKGANIPHTNPVQLEILTGSTVVARAWYNWGGDLDALADRSVIYNYPTDYTMTAKVKSSRKNPTPGTLADGQMPDVIKK